MQNNLILGTLGEKTIKASEFEKLFRKTRNEIQQSWLLKLCAFFGGFLLKTKEMSDWIGRYRFSIFVAFVHEMNREAPIAK